MSESARRRIRDGQTLLLVGLAGVLFVLVGASSLTPGTVLLRETVALGGPAPESATPSWHRLYPSTSPYGTPAAPAVYDPVDHELVLLTLTVVSTNTSCCVHVGHTWVYYSSTWHKLAIPSPSLPSFTATWDGRDGYLILFGGALTAETWTFLHNRWTERLPSTHPSDRWGAAMAYDSVVGETVLFGGTNFHPKCSPCLVDSDTWTYAAGVWTHRYPAAHPNPRWDASLGYDARDGVLVLFGGRNFSAYLSDTWTFAANGWTHRYPSAHPAARVGSAVAFDASTDTYLLEGGSSENRYHTVTVYIDTWAWATGQWTQVATTGPTVDGNGGMAYDAAVGYPVLMARPSSGTSVATWGYY